MVKRGTIIRICSNCGENNEAYLKANGSPIGRCNICRRLATKEYRKEYRKINGCTIEELKNYIGSQFQEGMNWENYGLYGWHIDHKKTIASFDLTNREQFLEACHYSNLQPLWANDNLKKSNKLNYQIEDKQ